MYVHIWIYKYVSRVYFIQNMYVLQRCIYVHIVYILYLFMCIFKSYIIMYSIYIWSLFSNCFIFTNPIFPGTLEQKAL